MSVVTISGVDKSYGLRQVLTDVSFSLEKGQKRALVGNNGVGKSTLLKIIAKIEDPDGGDVRYAKNTRVGYLPQDMRVVTDTSILAYLRSVVGIDLLERQIVQESILERSKQTPSGQEALKTKYATIGGYRFEHLVEHMLAGFGLEGISVYEPMSKLSSGQKSKVIISGILLKGVDLLLLDEPTNNLDLPAVIWLETYLRDNEAAAIIISHDRCFLDNTVGGVMEINPDSHELIFSSGSYSDYLQRKLEQIERQKLDYVLQQEEIERLSKRAVHLRQYSQKGSSWSGTDNDKMLRSFKQNRAGRSAHTAKSIENRIARMDKIEKPLEHSPLHIPLSTVGKSERSFIKATDLVVGYENGFKSGLLSFEVLYGDRVGIMGLNGTGKSTLLKTIAGTLQPLQGKVEIQGDLRIGFLRQEHENLVESETLFETISSKTNLTTNEVYSLLVKFGFSEHQVRKPIQDLSPGEKSRLLFALFSALSVNCLLLDEPTNHLDLEGLAALEELLGTYQGTVFLVSHDRHFLESVNLSWLYILDNGVLNRVTNIATYIEEAEKKAQSLLKTL